MIATFGNAKCQKLGLDYGIKNIENYKLEKNNLIVGINGSGKTRLLNLIKDLCEEENYTTVYMDFSQLGNKFQKSISTVAQTNDKKNKDQFNWALMYRDINGFSNFSDFVAFTNNSIENLLSFIKKSSNMEYSKRRFSQINDLLYEVLGRKVICIKNNFYFTDRTEMESPIRISDAINQMSPGERSILYFVLQINIIELLKGEYVLLIDEPETHLHPIALTKLIKYIKDNFKPKFSVIATHSVFLLPLYSFDEIKMIDNNIIKKPSSRLYEDVYSQLIGENCDGNSMYNFLASIYEWNYANFLAECFVEPTDVAIGNAKDPQFQKLLKIISQFTHQEEISVLDFGAGSGRIAKCFELLEKEQPNLNIWKKLKYSLYDKYKIDDSLPEKEWINEKIKSENELIKNNKKYDIIIVYNVLHEVSIEKWVQTLKLIINSLNYGGYLLFGERKVLSKGEKPYGKSGYLVLEKNELKLLFSTKSIEEIVLKEKKQDATICYAMKRSSIQIPTTEEVKKALIELKSRLNKEIYRILLSEKMDRKYAFYCQEYFNCARALDVLSLFDKIENIAKDIID